ncbi:MAG: glucose-6-phosphate 1-dehydrogenase [Chthoniobacter sp.]|jgi:glucose-6-phosphate 1-dehydrogenase|nr:glucose-6-phosphate 1-dehydrogenase [Chthoniobacter sp.]
MFSLLSIDPGPITAYALNPNILSSNPLREGLSSRPMPQPCNVVIFGASGDLTFRKLIPALYNLAADGDLPAATHIIGFARREKTDESWRTELKESTAKSSRSGLNEGIWSSVAPRIFYHQSEFGDLEGYRTLARKLDELDAQSGTQGNRLFYLSVSPTEYEGILTQLAAAGLNQSPTGGWTRVIVEKPFGTDLRSAHELNEVVGRVFHEKDTFRIDHYLGKETAQNILVLRFANGIFEPLWNHRYIDHVQITASETLGVEKRGPYYESSGALRDMVQNHLLQLLCLTAMEPPTDLGADSIRDEKVKVVRSLRQMTPEDVTKNVVRGQYGAGAISGKEVIGYREEDRVSPTSQTETYVALKVNVDNWRWADVPFYIRVGKRLPKGGTEIAIQFKHAPSVLFNKPGEPLGPNVLVIRIQPDEGISLRMQCKMPGNAIRIEPVKMDFHYGTSFGKASPEAYERLLLDAMSGDATLFARRDEVEGAWRFIDAIEDAWHKTEPPPPLCTYPSGSWGPKEADELLEREGRAWRRL